MRKIIVLIMFIFVSVPIISQTNEQETLFDSDEITFGGYGGPEVRFTEFNNDFGVLVGARGGLIVNSVFTVGLAGYGLVTSHVVDGYQGVPYKGLDSNAYLRIGYGGLHLGVIVEPNKLIHITAGILIGAGGAAYTTPYYYEWEGKHDRDDYFRTYERSAFFVAEPQLSAELNLLKFMRMEVNAGYRLISGVSLPNTTNRDLSGFSGSIIIKFGKF